MSFHVYWQDKIASVGQRAGSRWGTTSTDQIEKSS